MSEPYTKNTKHIKKLNKIILPLLLILALAVCQLSSSGAYADETSADALPADSSVRTELTELADEAAAIDTSACDSASRGLMNSAIDAVRAAAADSSLTADRAQLFADMIADVSAALILKADDSVLTDGEYEINGVLMHAAQDQESMGNSGIVQPMKLTVNKGSYTISFDTKQLEAGAFSGYLGEIRLFSGYYGDSAPSSDQSTEAMKVEAYHDAIDEYNDPETGTNSRMKGKKYPRTCSFEASPEHGMYWVQVYVPVMEAISEGAGTQSARLFADWSGFTQAASFDTDKSAIEKDIDQLDALAKKLAGDSSISDEQQILLTRSLTYARAVRDNTAIDQNIVDAAAKALASVERTFGYSEEELDALVSGKSSGSGSGSDSNKDDDNDSDDSGSKRKLDINDLDDGTYSITGHIYKVNKKTKSMANDAINHTIKLSVVDGKYYLTLNFTGLNVGSSKGYLGDMWYYKSGYKATSSGPSGSTAKVTVNSYQKNSSGKRINDAYGTNYPDKVTFPMIKEARKDGYCPLKFFVPIMEKISPGSGTQSAYLKLTLTSIKKASANASVFDQENAAASSSSQKLAAGLKGGSTLGSLRTLKTSLRSSSLTDSLADSLNETPGTVPQTDVQESASGYEAGQDREPPMRRMVIPGTCSIAGLAALAVLYTNRRKIAAKLIYSRTK